MRNTSTIDAAVQPHAGTDHDPQETTCPINHTELPPRQQKLISALVVEPEIRAAARAAGVGRTTAHRWLHQPAFHDELARRRDAALSNALDSFKVYATQAVTTLASLLSTNDERLRRQICNDILGHTLKIRELEDIERRMACLEKAMQNKAKTKVNT
jgi:hypothetical protein